MSENRLTDLLADRTLFGLDSSEEKELRELAENTAGNENESFELAAAVVQLSMFDPETMPEILERKLIRQGRDAIAGDGVGVSESASGKFGESPAKDSRDSAGSDPAMEKKTSKVGLAANDNTAAQNTAAQNTAATGNRMREIVAWGCAAAIGFVALMVWTNGRDTVKDLEQKLAQLQSKEAELAEKNDWLGNQVSSLQQSNDLLKQKINPDGRELYNNLVDLDRAIRWKWSPTENANTKANGEVVWDGENQQGVMRLVDLEQNDPRTSQYQLWIIEEDGRENPVDGGVFNVNASGEVFIPINAKLFASKPAAFAITVEKPNGVVVSKRANLPLLAKAPLTED